MGGGARASALCRRRRAALGALLTVLYIWRGNIWGNMLAHWIGDCSFVIVPLLTMHH